jgi:threonine dehydrogenase-like Zn-dependent dehydrogenase
MKAARFHAPGDIRVEDVTEPTAGNDEIVIAVKAASICGTDLRISKHGHFKLPNGQHRVLGHETAGVVVQAGAAVEGYAVGDRVSVTPNVGCGTCEFCRRGLNNMCPDYDAFGITLDGGFEEYLRVPGFALQRGNVFHLPDSVSFQEAALVEPFSCCLRGQQALNVSYGDVVVIVGAGPIGIFHTMLAKLAGAAKIIVSNRPGPRLDFAKAAGADVVVNADVENLTNVVKEHTNGRGADVVITCVSVPAVQTEAVDLLATHGRVNFFAGLGQGGTVPIDTNKLHYKGLVLTGTTGSSNADYEQALKLVGDGRAQLSQLVSRTYAIDDIHAAMNHAVSGDGMKAMVVFDDHN